MRNLIGRFAGFVFVAAAMMSFGITWSIVVCWKLTIVGLAAAPFMYGITRGFEFVSGEWEKRSNDASEAACSIFAETFSNIRTVRALALEGYYRRKYAKATRDAFKVGMKRASYSGMFFGLTDSGIQFATGCFYFLFLVAPLSCKHLSSDIGPQRSSSTTGPSWLLADNLASVIS
jgi:ATP-binding cassette subfamily B (MDR/TAP) protein 1